MVKPRKNQNLRRRSHQLVVPRSELFTTSDSSPRLKDLDVLVVPTAWLLVWRPKTRSNKSLKKVLFSELDCSFSFFVRVEKKGIRTLGKKTKLNIFQTTLSLEFISVVFMSFFFLHFSLCPHHNLFLMLSFSSQKGDQKEKKRKVVFFFLSCFFTPPTHTHYLFILFVHLFLFLKF